VERSSAYFPWTPVFRRLLPADDAAREAEVLRLLSDDPRLAPVAPLLNPVLHLALPENDRTRAVGPRGRAELTRDLLVRIFARTTADGPVLLVLEDAHWFDSASCALADALRFQHPALLIIVATRPVAQAELSVELNRLV